MNPRAALLISSVTVAFSLTSAAARAQTLDDLQCYTTRDPVNVDAEMLLESELGVTSGCKIKRAALVCVPAASSVGDDAALPDIAGQELEDVRICYKVKCPATAACGSSLRKTPMP